MAVTAAYTLYAFQTSGGIIDQIVDQNVAIGLLEVLAAGDGKVDAEFAAVMSAAPILGFTTTKIATALGVAGIDGLAITSAADMFFQKLVQGGTRAGLLSHVKITSATGLLIPRSLSANQGETARLTYELLCRSSDGSTSPLTIATSQTLTGSPATDELFTVGAATVNGVTVDGVVSIDVNFGIAEYVAGGGGDTYPTFASIMSRRPTITIRCMDVALLATFGTAGIAISSTTAVTFRQFAEGGVASGSPVTLTVNEGRISAASGGATADGQAIVVLQITPTFDGTNAVIVVS